MDEENYEKDKSNITTKTTSTPESSPSPSPSNTSNNLNRSSNSSFSNDVDEEEANLSYLSPPKSPRLNSNISSQLKFIDEQDLPQYKGDEISNDTYNDNVVLSDSDELASQSSLDLQNSSSPSKNIKFQIQNLSNNLKQQQLQRQLSRQLSSDEEEEMIDDEEINLLKKSISNSSRSKRSSTTKKRTDSESPSSSRRRSSSPDSTSDSQKSLKSRKKIRRKSNQPSEKSNRSNNNEILGSGYTSMPASGKVFRNLLILEESLREQVIQQKAMRRKYLTFLAILCSIIATLTHYLFISSSNQGSTTLRVILQFFLLATIVTLMLYHLSGEYQKTIVLPRKFLSSTNKGLRQLNIRLVKIKIPFTDKITDLIRDFSSSIIEIILDFFHKISPTSQNNKHSKLEVFLIKCKSQCQPRIGVTEVKLVLNARVFNIDIRESWELYRSEFWINEGVRRRNHLLNFINNPTTTTPIDALSENKLIKRRKRKLSSIPSKLSEQNLQKLSNDYEKIKSPSPVSTPI